MMQQVATSKVEIAAIAANTPQSDQQDPSFTDDFGKLLQQHQAARDSSGKSNKETNYSSKENVNAASGKPDNKHNSTADAAEQTKQSSAEPGTLSARDAGKETAVQAQHIAKREAGKVTTTNNIITSADSAATQKNKEPEGNITTNGSGEELVKSARVAVSNPDLAEQVLSEINELVKQFESAKLSAKSAQIPKEELSSAQAPTDNVAQAAQIESEEWSSLIEKLHTLASSGSGSENSKPISAEELPILAENVANQVQQTVRDNVISKDESVANLVGAQADAANAGGKIDSVQAPTLVNVVAQILNQIDISQTSSTEPDADIQIETVVDKLASLQGAFENSNVAETVGQKMSEVVAMTKSSNLAQDAGKETNEAGQKIGKSMDKVGLDAGTEQLSNTLNKSLISTVLTPTSDAKKITNVDSLKQSDTAVTQDKNLVSPVSELELADIQTQVQELIPKQNVGNELSPRSTLQVLAGMPTEKLDKALNNLLQRLSTEQSSSDVQSAQLNQQQVAATAATQMEQSGLVHTNKDFLAALKAGVDEFKAQLAQGREPGIDLKDLVADVMSKSTATSDPITKLAQQTEIAVKGFSQVLEFAQQLNGALEQHQSNIVSQNNYMAREAGQGQLDQLKQFQAQTSQFDKAVNISKPEGAQQLAEKVRWMVNAKQMVAEIRLDPAELGSMQVKVSVTGESANISFVVQSQQARDAMDSATPRLREMLAEKGIELGQSSVKQEQDQNAQEGSGQLAGQQHQGAEQGADEDNELANEGFTQQPIVNGALGGIDYFV